MTAESAPYAKGQRATKSSAARRPRLTSRYGFPVPGSWIMGMALPDTCGICPFHRFAISFSAFCVSPFAVAHSRGVSGPSVRRAGKGETQNALDAQKSQKTA